MQVAKGGFSPFEQYTQRGSSGPWTDVYAMAATVYYTLTGKLPPVATDRVVEDTISWEEPGLKALSAQALEALQKAMVISAKNRMQSMEELEKGLYSTTVKPEPAPAPQPVQETKPEPQPAPETKPESQPEQEAKPESQPTPEPTPQVKTEPKPEAGKKSGKKLWIAAAARWYGQTPVNPLMIPIQPHCLQPLRPQLRPLPRLRLPQLLRKCLLSLCIPA